MGLYNLPESLQLTLTLFLLSSDLLRLSHVSSDGLRVFSADLFWRPRLLTITSDGSAKRILFHEHSHVFHGSAFNDNPRSEFSWHGLATVLSDRSVVPLSWDISWRYIKPTSNWLRGALSYDLWFSLAPDEPACIKGGVLLEAHSERIRFGPRLHCQSAIVDMQGHLYCTIVNECTTPIATNLQSERWYHLALTWNDGYQRVYLDGELAAEDHGPVTAEWRQLSIWVVGSGFIHADAVPRPTYCWRRKVCFRGVIDDFRIWDHALSSEQVKKLTTQVDLADLVEPVYSMKKANAKHSHVQRLRCTRPLEKICRPYFIDTSERVNADIP